MLTKQAVDISFAQGLETKVDPKRVPMGKFLNLENMVFTKGGLLQKRNGFAKLQSLPDTSYSYLTTFNDNLTAIGTNIAAFTNTSDTWVSKGTIQPLSLNTLPVIRNNLNQIQGDCVVASNGAACAVYLEQYGNNVSAKYVIFDSVTGQNLIAPSYIPVSSGTVTGGVRVFLLGNNFILVFTNVISSVSHLQYVAISSITPSSVGANTDIAAAYDAASTLAWDGYVTNDKLYLAYNTSSGGQAVKVTYLSSALFLANAISLATYKATMISVTTDVTNPVNPTVYVSFYRSDTSVGYVAAFNSVLNLLLNPTSIITATTVLNITSAAQNGAVSVFYEVQNAYSYDSAIPTNYVSTRSVTVAGVVSAAYVVIRSLGLASKAFIVDSVIYFLGAYQSSYQSTYFLINGSSSTSASPVVSSKLAYANGGGYVTQGLCGVTVNGQVAQIFYLIKDLIQAVNKNTNVASGTQVAGVYAQTGINLATFTFGTGFLDSSEIGNNLHISGGFPWMYDGYLPVEHSFFLWPDSVEVQETGDPNPNATVTGGSNVMTGISSLSNIVVGMNISGTNVPIPTTVVSIDVGANTITMSRNANGNSTGTYVFSGYVDPQKYYYQVTYEWSDNQGNIHRSAPSIPVTVTNTTGNSSILVKIPFLRLTMKTANPVKIVIYRWSVGQQIYYQTTSVILPLINDPANDSITYQDINSDATILGNNIIYTNGGVVENIQAAGTDIMALFDTRLWLLDSEDRNLLWYSKQVIETTPVETSDLFTLYVPPVIATPGSTGPILSLAPMDDKLIIGKKNALFYINGAGPDNTGANNQYSQPIFITSSVGCDNQRSLVLIPSGLMFQSDKGIWLLDRGLNPSYIGAPVESFTQGALVNSAVVVPETNQVRFTLDSGITLMYDYFYNQWGVFTTSAISSCIFQNMHTFINAQGSVYQESPGTYLDGSNPVLVAFQTGPLRLGDLQNYQRAYFFYFLGTYYSPHKLAVGISYDYTDAIEQMTIIAPDNYSTPYGSGLSQSPYGQGNPFGGPSNLEVERIFLHRQRCMAFAIHLQELFDPSFGTEPGQGLSLSGINLVMGMKRGFRPQSAATSEG